VKGTLRYFETLGERVAQKWRAVNHNESQFPRIAADALRALPPHEHVTGDDVIAWVLDAPRLPSQPGLHANFGQPAVTVFAGEGFYIDVYYWVDATTAIHQHRFDGAFTVLAGSSLHSAYRFLRAEPINSRTMLGELSLQTSELLAPGDVRPIVAGREFVHALFHLDRPSVSVVVRTHTNVAAGQQWSYVGDVATDPYGALPVELDLQLQTLQLLARSAAPTHVPQLRALLARADIERTWHFLLHAWHRLSAPDFATCLQVTRKRFPKLAPRFLRTLEFARRQDALVLRRASVHDAELRYFLALLLNVPSRARILSLVKARFPRRDAVKTIVRWVLALQDVRVLNQNRRPFGSEDFWLNGGVSCDAKTLAQLVAGKRVTNHAAATQLRKSPLLAPLF
jgi:hypothetical protein